MIYSINEYAEKFFFKGQLPSGHHAKKLPGKTGDWVIQVDEIPKVVVTKTDPPKPDLKTINRKYFNFR